MENQNSAPRVWMGVGRGDAVGGPYYIGLPDRGFCVQCLQCRILGTCYCAAMYSIFCRAVDYPAAEPDKQQTEITERSHHGARC